MLGLLTIIFIVAGIMGIVLLNPWCFGIAIICNILFYLIDITRDPEE